MKESDIKTTDISIQKVESVPLTEQGELIVNEITDLTLLDLKSLDEKTSKAILDRSGKVSYQDSRDVKQYHRISVQTFGKGPTMVLPQEYCQEENWLAVLLYKLCSLHNLQVAFYDREHQMKELNKDDENVVKGLILSTDVIQPLRLIRSKQGVELGRTLGWALRVKAEFSSLNEFGLTQESLIRNQSFFGNNPGDKIKDSDETKPFLIKSFLTRILPSDDLALIDLIVYYLSSLGFYNIESEKHQKIMSQYFVRYDTLVRKHHTPIYKKTRGGGQQITGWMKPNKPNPSPCFMPEENAFIRKLLSFVFEELDAFSKDTSNYIQKYGFSVCKDWIASNYIVRKQVRKRFADCTTKRLQALRKLKKNENLKKKDITSEDVKTFLSDRKDLVNNFVNEIFLLLKDDQNVIDALHHSFKQHRESLLEGTSCRDILAYEVHVMYRNMKLIESEIPKLSTKVGKDFTEKINTCIRATVEFINRYEALQQICRRNITVKEVFNNRREQLMKTFIGLIEDYKFLQSRNMSNIEVDLVLSEINSPMFKEYSTFQSDMERFCISVRDIILAAARIVSDKNLIKDLDLIQIPKPLNKT